MSEKRVTVTLPESQMRALHRLAVSSPVVDADLIAAALPPEWPEGTIARITHDDRRSWLAEWDGSRWVTQHNDGRVWMTVSTPEGSKVEPIHTLADDEIAVRIGLVHESDLRQAAKWLHRKKGWTETPELLTRMANTLAAEADR